MLSRLTGQHEVVIGTPVANRERVEIEGLIGFFVNTLALRVGLCRESRRWRSCWAGEGTGARSVSAPGHALRAGRGAARPRAA